MLSKKNCLCGAFLRSNNICRFISETELRSHYRVMDSEMENSGIFPVDDVVVPNNYSMCTSMCLPLNSEIHLRQMDKYYFIYDIIYRCPVVRHAIVENCLLLCPRYKHSMETQCHQ